MRFDPGKYDPSLQRIRASVIGAWSPFLGPSGYRLLDRVGTNHGVLTNMDPVSAWTRATINQRTGYAIDFDGVDDYISAFFPPLELSKQDCTFQSWVKTSTATSGVIVSLGSSSNFNPYLTIETSSPVVGYRNDLGADLFTVTGGTFTAEWRLLTVVSTPSRTTLYQNGVVVNSVSQSSSTTRTFNRFSFAARNRAGTIGSYAACLNSEAILFNRAIPPSEIATLYRLGPGWLAPLELQPIRIRTRAIPTATPTRNRSSRYLAFPG